MRPREGTLGLGEHPLPIRSDEGDFFVDPGLQVLSPRPDRLSTV